MYIILAVHAKNAAGEDMELPRIRYPHPLTYFLFLLLRKFVERFAFLMSSRWRIFGSLWWDNNSGMGLQALSSAGDDYAH